MKRFVPQTISLNNDWLFYLHENDKPIKVNVPHNWNSKDGQDGGNDYYRGKCLYTKTFKNDKSFKDKVLMLEFQGVNASADVIFNKKNLKHHDGGYSTFRVVIPNELLKEENLIEIYVDNSVDYKVYPQKADFTFYGGIYRDVNLLVLNKDYFNREIDGGLGAKIDVYVEDNLGIVEVEPHIVGEGDVRITLLDGNKEVASGEKRIEISNPHLWNGLKDPYLYTLKVELLKDNEVQDEIIKRKRDWGKDTVG